MAASWSFRCGGPPDLSIRCALVLQGRSSRRRRWPAFRVFVPCIAIAGLFLALLWDAEGGAARSWRSLASLVAYIGASTGFQRCLHAGEVQQRPALFDLRRAGPFGPKLKTSRPCFNPPAYSRSHRLRRSGGGGGGAPAARDGGIGWLVTLGLDFIFMFRGVLRIFVRF